MFSLFINASCRDCLVRIPAHTSDDRCAPCHEKYTRYINSDWGLAENIAARKAVAEQGICFQCDRKLSAPNTPCGYCNANLRSYTNESNPYKKVWNNPAEEDAYLTTQAQENILFAPTAEELAKRHKATAWFLLAEARHLGRSAAGHQKFLDAQCEVRLAESFYLLSAQIITRSR